MLMSTLKITGLFIYPIKSMKAITLEQAQLTPMGLLNGLFAELLTANHGLPSSFCNRFRRFINISSCASTAPASSAGERATLDAS